MTTAPVIVGVDGSAQGLGAVDLAVREAEARNRPLRVVYADAWSRDPAWTGTALADPFTDPLATRPEAAVHAALERIADRSRVRATGHVVRGHPASVLVDESHEAALVVVGHRGRGGYPGLLLGSVARDVATHAFCPVLVARGTPDPGGPVVVGVNGSPDSHSALSFAFEEADLRGAELVALHAWTHPVSTGPGDMLPLVHDSALLAGEEARVLAESLAGWQTKYPDVAVHERLVRSRPGPALVEATRGAQLVVVGAHGHRPVVGWLLGSVAHLLLHQSHCPIAVVRH